MRRPPHLPFLAGPPAFQVALRPISLSAWLLPDTESSVLAAKRSLIAARRDEVVAATDQSEAAQAEAGALVGGAGADLVEAAASISDDLCVMARDGAEWVLTAAVVCAPSFWSLAENIARPLAHLHAPVPDRTGPDGSPGLAARISRVFDALTPDTILERFNWTVQAGADRYTPSSAPLIARAAATDVAAAAGLLHLRVERQTIRKLPASGTVLFTIRVCIDPLVAAFEVPGAREAFAAAWTGAADHVRRYKNWASLERHVAAVLAA